MSENQLINSLENLSNLPNSSTLAVHQIKKIDFIIQNQSSNINHFKSKVDSLSNNYNKLLTNEQKKYDLSDIQSFAELIDQELRVLEGCVKIIEENKKL